MRAQTLFQILFAASLLAVQPSHATPPADPPSYQMRTPAETNLGDILQDLQKFRASDTHFYLLIWMPSAFWAKAMQSNGDDPGSTQNRKVLALFDNYTVVVSTKTRQSFGEEDEYAGQDELRKSLRLLGDDGKAYSPLDDKRLGSEMKMIAAMLKTVLNQIDEKNADQMHILVFPGKDGAGKRFADATADGSLRFEIDGQRFAYRLPLGSLLRPRIDPVSGESFPGNYGFNPYTGNKLDAGPASK